MPISTSITDFVPYTIENGVLPVRILLIVLYAQSMLDKSSTYSFLDFSSFVFKFLKIVLLVTSTCPFAQGWSSEEKWWKTARSEQNCLNSSLSNCLVLFEMITFGIPNRQTMFFHMKFLVFLSVILGRGSTFIHLVINQWQRSGIFFIMELGVEVRVCPRPTEQRAMGWSSGPSRQEGDD